MAIKCRRCGRILTDPESIKRGIGPECENKESRAGKQNSIFDKKERSLTPAPSPTRRQQLIAQMRTALTRLQRQYFLEQDTVEFKIGETKFEFTKEDLKQKVDFII